MSCCNRHSIIADEQGTQHVCSKTRFPSPGTFISNLFFMTESYHFLIFASMISVFLVPMFQTYANRLSPYRSTPKISAACHLPPQDKVKVLYPEPNVLFLKHYIYSFPHVKTTPLLQFFLNLYYVEQPFHSMKRHILSTTGVHNLLSVARFPAIYRHNLFFS